MKYIVKLVPLLILICFCVEDVCAENASERLFQITGDRTERKEHGEIVLALEKAEAQIAGQDAKIEADTIAFYKKTRIVEATGHVRIIRNSVVTTGAKFRFKVDSKEYLVTQPGIHVTGPKVICRGKAELDCLSGIEQKVAQHYFRSTPEYNKEIVLLLKIDDTGFVSRIETAQVNGFTLSDAAVKRAVDAVRQAEPFILSRKSKRLTKENCCVQISFLRNGIEAKEVIVLKKARCFG